MSSDEQLKRLEDLLAEINASDGDEEDPEIDSTSKTDNEATSHHEAKPDGSVDRQLGSANARENSRKDHNAESPSVSSTKAEASPPLRTEADRTADLKDAIATEDFAGTEKAADTEKTASGPAMTEGTEEITTTTTENSNEPALTTPRIAPEAQPTSPLTRKQKKNKKKKAKAKKARQDGPPTKDVTDKELQASDEVATAETPELSQAELRDSEESPATTLNSSTSKGRPESSDKRNDSATAHSQPVEPNENQGDEKTGETTDLESEGLGIRNLKSSPKKENSSPMGEAKNVGKSVSLGRDQAASEEATLNSPEPQQEQAHDTEREANKAATDFVDTSLEKHISKTDTVANIKHEDVPVLGANLSPSESAARSHDSSSPPPEKENCIESDGLSKTDHSSSDLVPSNAESGGSPKASVALPDQKIDQGDTQIQEDRPHTRKSKEKASSTTTDTPPSASELTAAHAEPAEPASQIERSSPKSSKSDSNSAEPSDIQKPDTTTRQESSLAPHTTKVEPSETDSSKKLPISPVGSPKPLKHENDAPPGELMSDSASSEAPDRLKNASSEKEQAALTDSKPNDPEHSSKKIPAALAETNESVIDEGVDSADVEPTPKVDSVPPQAPTESPLDESRSSKEASTPDKPAEATSAGSITELRAGSEDEPTSMAADATSPVKLDEVATSASGPQESKPSDTSLEDPEVDIAKDAADDQIDLNRSSVEDEKSEPVEADSQSTSEPLPATGPDSVPKDIELMKNEKENVEAASDTEAVAEENVTESKPVARDDADSVLLFVSLASGVRGTMGRYNKAVHILNSYDIKFTPVEITLDERALRLWKLKGVSKNKRLPAVFRDGDMKCDFDELVEANEIEDVEDLIFDDF